MYGWINVPGGGRNATRRAAGGRETRAQSSSRGTQQYSQDRSCAYLSTANARLGTCSSRDTAGDSGQATHARLSIAGADVFAFRARLDLGIEIDIDVSEADDSFLGV
nr:hypothetical protein CFP56_21836 [Quercus suber]